MNDLELKDIELLQYISDNPGFDKSDLHNKFELAENFRLEKLLSSEYVIDNRENTLKGDKSKYLGLYLITDKGMTFLVDYKICKDNEKKEFYRKSIIVPLIVSISANLAITLIKWLLSLI